MSDSIRNIRVPTKRIETNAFDALENGVVTIGGNLFLLVNLMSAGTTVTLTIDSTQADVIKNLGFGESLVMLILAALLSIIVIRNEAGFANIRFICFCQTAAVFCGKRGSRQRTGSSALQIMFHNKALTYVPTESNQTIKAYEAEQSNTSKKKKAGKGAKPEVTDNTKNKEDFEAIKRKTKSTDIYKLYNTNLHEKIEMQKAKELLEKSN